MWTRRTGQGRAWSLDMCGNCILRASGAGFGRPHLMLRLESTPEQPKRHGSQSDWCGGKSLCFVRLGELLCVHRGLVGTAPSRKDLGRIAWTSIPRAPLKIAPKEGMCAINAGSRWHPPAAKATSSGVTRIPPGVVESSGCHPSETPTACSTRRSCFDPADRLETRTIRGARHHPTRVFGLIPS